MHLVLKRLQNYPDYSLGVLYIDGVLHSFVMEDEKRLLKVHSETRIPAGKYPLKLNTTGGMNKTYKKKISEHIGMIEIKNIPNFSSVYIHIGNDDDDTAGCPLIGFSTVIGVNYITQSTNAYRSFYKLVASALLRKEEVNISIIDEGF